MVVEDSPVQRAHAVGLCRQLGIEMIYEACDGAEALQQLDMLQLKPDLMLIDLHMPVMDGVELITQMHERDWKIPTLVVSSQQLSILNAVQDLSSALGLPMLGSLPKPVRREQLASALQQHQSLPGQVRQDVRRTPIAFTSHDLCQAIDSDQLQVHYQPKLAINLSPLLLGNPCIVPSIADMVANYGVQPSQVVLEITESAGVEHLGRAIAVLTRLRLQDFGLSLDDYGTGCSSMQQLARLPFTELKIDRSFVHGAHQRRNLGVILESALDMAKRLELLSVAEGIETMEDWRLLQRCGCNVGQGYLIGRPMPACDIPAWMRQHRTRLPELRAPASSSPRPSSSPVRAAQAA